jgi:hypothetical protein
MSDLALFAFDLAAITVLAYGIYFRRHRRRDLLLAYIALNIGVMAVALVLINNAVGVGLGLGLFGVLSIIRLRSSELSQAEVAYYFVALALGLLAGVQPDPLWFTPVLGTLLVAAMYVIDHPRLLARYRHQVMTLDAAYTDEGELVRRLEALLGADVQRVHVTQVDLVRDVTVVDVSYRVGTVARRSSSPALHEAVPSANGTAPVRWSSDAVVQ